MNNTSDDQTNEHQQQSTNWAFVFDSKYNYVNWKLGYIYYITNNSMSNAPIRRANEPIDRNNYSPIGPNPHSGSMIHKAEHYILNEYQILFGLCQRLVVITYLDAIYRLTSEMLPDHSFDPYEFFNDLHDFCWGKNQLEIIYKWGWRTAKASK